MYCSFMIAEKLSSPVYYLMISIMVLNLFQRKHAATGEKKRFATLWLAGTLLVLQVGIGLMVNFKQPDWLLLPLFLIWGLSLYLLRGKIFLFRSKCVSCGARLDSKEWLGRDDNLCARCVPSAETPGAPEAPGSSGSSKGASGNPPPSNPVDFKVDEENRHELGKGEVRDDIPRSVDAVDWEAWNYAEKAVICYLFEDDKVLMIHKKTGLGRGKVNAPGGRIESWEMPRDAAVRELQEETGITPKELEEVAQLHFIFTDGYSLKGTVFFAYAYEGEPVSTEEADPFWVSVDAIPYDQMWEDDKLWLPRALSGKYITGRFIFEKERMLSQEIIEKER